jgi:hypothetical protein
MTNCGYQINQINFHKKTMSKLLTSFVTSTLLTLGLAISGTTQAMAMTLGGTATVTADNHYGLFSGDKNGNSLNFVGRNELGSGGSQGAYNWSSPETWNFNVDSKDYLYMVVWDDQSVDETWLGQFGFSNGASLQSKATDWEYIISKNSNPFSRAGEVPIAERDSGFLSGNFEGNVPKNGELAQEIQAGNWVGAVNRGANGQTGPWGKIQGISDDAQFLNTTTADQGRGTDGNTHYTIFRTRNNVGQLAELPAQAVPESSSTTGLVAFGVLSAGAFVKRKSKAS